MLQTIERCVSWFLICCSLPSVAQVVFNGRLLAPRVPGSAEQMPLTAIRCFASQNGSDSQTLAFATFETEPAGWYRLSGSAGTYTLLFSAPARFVRPILRTHVVARDGEVLERNLAPRFDYAVFFEGDWDEVAATDYFQTFVARGTSVTHVGLKLAHDGVDGIGPGAQNLLVSIHGPGEGAPDTWPQIGPAVPVLGVDCGGDKNYVYSVGFRSGEVPLVPGKTYAVHLRAEQKGNTFQPFWAPGESADGDCYRIGPDGKGFADRDLWLAVGTDGDGLLIPYNKRVHKEFSEFAGFAAKWSQTYVAQGRSLAAVQMYAAVSGTQPGLYRQRAVVRVRRGGPKGPVVGVEKIAIGNGVYTGDASWGVFGATYAPGEVPLVPGETYAIELESAEHYHTLHGYVNIKGEVSNDVAGFNPYHQAPGDNYPNGTAYRNGTEKMGFDLDMQVIEYEATAEDEELPLDAENLLANGDLEIGTWIEGNTDAGRPDAWDRFAIDPGTSFWYLMDDERESNRIARVIGGSINGRTVDGGYVQRVDGLSPDETYVLQGEVRSSYAVDIEHQCMIGLDPTGQVSHATAATIQWNLLPKVHGRFVAYRSDPMRPRESAISVWLRGRTTSTADRPFEADFDRFTLRRVRTEPPAP